jgi:hypothetical protein
MKMKFSGIFYTIIFFLLVNLNSGAQTGTTPDFTFGNVSYFNLSIGELCNFNELEIEILRVDRHFTKLRVDNDTVWLKVARRSPALAFASVNIFVADNKAVKAISGNSPVHGLLKKDVLLAVSPIGVPMTDNSIIGFPVSFTQGYLWRTLEDSYMFSYQQGSDNDINNERSYAGVGIDMRETRAMDKHQILSMENGRVVWVETRIPGTVEPQAAVCIQSESSPNIFYIYEHLHSRGIAVKRNQRILKGDGIGYAWGNGNWNHFRIGVVMSDSIPIFANRHHNTVNFYPQMLDLYFGRQPVFSNSFTKGQIYFGRASHLNANAKNVSGFEEYHGTGWILGRWNTAEKVEWVSSRRSGNARLRKTLFAGQPAQCTNPRDWYEFEINVRNGIYRIRALVGDHFQPSWQKLEFEGVGAGTFTRNAGDLVWTSERIVKVHDGKLTVRIYTDGDRIAGLSEIVFQQASL